MSNPNLGELFTQVWQKINQMKLHVCLSGEYNVTTLVPTVDYPEENTFYLVPDGSGNNVYTEWIYANNNWERFGQASIDLSTYATKSELTSLAPKANPTFTGTITIGTRTLDDSEGNGTVAIGSNIKTESTNIIAVGDSLIAGGNNSICIGTSSETTGMNSAAFGGTARAWADYSLANGYNVKAQGAASHAEGNIGVASGVGSHCEGLRSIANGRQEHVEGKNNWGSPLYHDWEEDTEYIVGKVVFHGTDVVRCIEAHTSTSEFDSSKWEKPNNLQETSTQFAHIVGNGLSNYVRSNAYALDWDGNGHFMGDIYVGCDKQSKNGIRLARIPDPPSTDGTYTLQATVSSGVITYTWVTGV